MTELTAIVEPSTLSVAPIHDWLDRVDPEWVTVIPYSYARRHEVLAVCEEEGRVHVLSVARLPLAVVTELRRRLGR